MSPVPGTMSNDEVARRLDDAVREVREVAAQMREDRREFASTYLRRDVYDADQKTAAAEKKAAAADVDEMKRGIEKNAEWKRQVWLGISVALIGAAAAIAVGLLSLAHTR